MNNYLYHYGVKGMKWGVRRYRNEDGTLTSAGKKRYADGTSNTRKFKHRVKLEKKYRDSGYSEKEAKDKADRAIKIEKTLAIIGGITVTAAVAYVASKEIRRRVDGTIKWNTPIQNISSFSNKDISKPFYAAYLDKDKLKYRGLYGYSLKGNAQSTGLDKVYNTTIKSGKDLKIASHHNAQKVLAELARSDSEFKQRYPKGISRHDYRRFNEDLRFFNNSMHDSERSMASKFYNALKNKGYNGIYDIHDQNNDYQTKAPVILFDTGKMITKKVEEITSTSLNGDHSVAKAIQNKEFNMYRTKKTLNKIGGYTLGSLGIIGVGATYKLENPRSRTNNFIKQYRKEHPNTKLSDEQIKKIYEEARF